MFNLKENNTTVSKEFIGGLTTFLAMTYIMFVNPSMLSSTGMPIGGVFIGTILATVIGTLIMGLFANVPYSVAPAMGLNAFFTYTVCSLFGFVWQEALAMVFICGIINVIITVTKIRKSIILSIPKNLQLAISGGIGIFIAYTGFLNVGLIDFSSGVPTMVAINSPVLILFVIGLFLAVILTLTKVKTAFLISIAITTIIGIFLGVVDLSAMSFSSIGQSFNEFSMTFGACFSSYGFISLFSDPSKYFLIIITIFAFSISDTFDTIGTFIGTGIKTNIFSKKDMDDMKNGSGFSSKMDKALFADSIATSIGAILGTSNTSTYLESAAGIESGGKTGLTSVFTAILFLISIFLSPIVAIVPTAAIAPILVMVGIMMLGSFKEINWDDLSDAIPAFFASFFMALSYNISYGIAMAFITYCITKIVKKQTKDVHIIIWISSILFILNFIVLAII